MVSCIINNLIRVSKTAHAAHDTKDVVVGGVDADFSGIMIFDGRVRDNKLKGGVVDAREIAGA